MKKKAFITGIGGQDGSFLAEFLLEKDYELHGLVRKETIFSRMQDQMIIHVGNAHHPKHIADLIQQIQPDECYHLASTSFVSYDLDAEVSIVENNFNSTYHLLANIKKHSPHTKFYFAGSSEMFGEVSSAPQNETTAFNPRSIYGISKTAGAQLCRNYRKQQGLFICNGILFNHESYRRPLEFVTRKIAHTVAKIACDQARELELGNLDAKRDWGYAPEYVEAMWRMLNHQVPDDYVIATGKLYSVREVVEHAFKFVNLNYLDYVKTNPAHYRQTEAVPLQGDANKAKQQLDWQATKNIFSIIEEMIEYDLQRLKQKEIL
ncbi:MAG: GDP-mannose 4,6-dehydratase [Candidatus Berkiella sp.]